jgi:Ran GTPase-activating protein (RanGAP) involved in mRNA processing and transport
VSLLRCLHEAQDPALCLYVAERLGYELDLSDTSLSPLDCLSVSLFISSVAGNEISVDLHKCNIDDFGATCLSRYLYADKNLDYVSKVTIDLAGNEIHEEGTLHIAWMLYFIEHLYLSHNPIGDTGASLISQAVRETATLKTLILNDCGITSRGAEALSRALAQNSSLERLAIVRNYLVGDWEMSHVADALKQNKQLKELWISQCGMTDNGAASLASALVVNNSLKMLHIGGTIGAQTEDGLSAIVHSLANNSMFVKLALPAGFVSTTTADRLSREVNKARKRNGLPPIEIEGDCMLYGCVIPICIVLHVHYFYIFNLKLLLF